MSRTTISWADYSFNPWIGCTKVSPGCAHCYASVYGHRFGVEWGPGKPRRRTSAAVLAKLKYRDDQFKAKRIYTAWDNRKDEEIFLRGINLMLNAGIRPQNIMVYFLCGYWPGERWEDIFFRFETMVKIGLLPYPMVYDNKNKMLKKFQCWVIQRGYQFIPWEEYSQGANTRTKTDDAQQPLALAAP